MGIVNRLLLSQIAKDSEVKLFDNYELLKNLYTHAKSVGWELQPFADLFTYSFCESKGEQIALSLANTSVEKQTMIFAGLFMGAGFHATLKQRYDYAATFFLLAAGLFQQMPRQTSTLSLAAINSMLLTRTAEAALAAITAKDEQSLAVPISSIQQILSKMDCSQTTSFKMPEVSDEPTNAKAGTGSGATTKRQRRGK